MSLSFAVDIPANAHIVVKAGSPIYDISGAQPVIPSSANGWPAVVVADQGERLVVKLESRGCVASLDAAYQMADVRFSVDEKSLLPLVTQQVGGRNKDGSTWTVAAGTPILKTDGVKANIPLGDLSLAVTVEELPQALFLATDLPFFPSATKNWGTIAPVGGSLGTFNDAPLLYPESPQVDVGTDGTVTWTNRCVRLTFKPAATPSMNTGIGGLIGAMGTRSRTPLSLRDGTEVGTVWTLLNFEGPEEFVDSRRCLHYFFNRGASQSMEFCVPKEPVVEAPANTSTSSGGVGATSGGVGAPSSGTPVGAGEPIILGALDKSVIDAVIKRNMASIRYCYQRGLTSNPNLAGRVTIKFVIANDGKVSSATVKTTTLKNEEVESCIVKRFLKMTFPSPVGGGIVIVSYPFVFSPG